MTKPKRHHYIHESYLDQFVLNGRPLHVLDKWENGRIFPGTPKNICVEAQYYSQPIHSEKRMDAKLETYFSSVESRWPSLIAEIEASQILSNQSYGFFVECLAMLRTRVPNTRKALEGCLRSSVRERAAVVREPPPTILVEAFKRQLEKSNSEHKNVEATLENMIDHGFISVSVDPHRSLVLMPQMVRKIAPLLASMKCRSFLHNKTDLNFITNDNPVIFYKKTDVELHPQPYPDENEEEFCLVFPISPRIAFYYNSKEEKRKHHRPIYSIKTVEKINSLVALFADRFVVGSTRGSVEVFGGIENICPVPDFEKSAVLPDLILNLTYKFGEPLKMEDWKHDFQK